MRGVVARDAAADEREPALDAAWRDRSARLTRTIETLERVSTALRLTPDAPAAICHAVVDAAVRHFDARWAAIAFAADGPRQHELPPLILRTADGRFDAPPSLRALAEQALAVGEPVAAGKQAAVAAPILPRDEIAGALVVGLPAGAQVQERDLAVLLALANHAGLALHDAFMRPERERRLLDEERNRIARELHDTVAQDLLGIGMMLEWCRQQEPASSPIRERLAASQERVRSALHETRTVIYELSAEPRDDLRAALDELVEELADTTHLDIALRARGRPRALPRDAELAFAHIAREALFNVARHAEASRAWLTVRYGERSLGLTVADDGRGHAELLQRRLERAGRGGSGYHRGLANIAERARELGARVRFAPRRGGGVRLELTAPWPP